MNLIASDFVTHPVISVNEATSVSEPVELLNGKMISDAPVLNDYGMQVGVISITNLLAANSGEDEFGHADFHTSRPWIA